MGKTFKRFIIFVLLFALTVTALPAAEGFLPAGSGLLSDVVKSLSTVEASTTYTQGTEWEKYGNYYFYNQMSRTEQVFYDALNARCIEFMTGEEDAEEYVYKNVSYYLVGYVSSDSLTIAQMVQIAKIFKYNNPQYYFLSTMIFPKSADNAISLTTYSKFASGAVRAGATSQVNSAIRRAQSSIAMIHDDAGKVKAIHDYIIDLVDYQDKVIKEDTAYSQSIYSVFGDATGGPVCSGYAGAFMVLCNANGIDCISVTSDMHQWNKVRINDTWYNMDLTWDDKGTDDDGVSQKIYTYYCRANSMLPILDETDYHTIEDFWTDFLLPECIHDSGSGKDAVGELYSPVSAAVSPGYTSKAVTGTAMYTVSLYSATSGADIYYTTDGRTPEIGSTKSRLYTKPFKVTTNTLVRAVAVRDGYKDSIILKTTISEEMSGGTSVRLSDCTVKLNKTKFKYTGLPIKPKVLSVTYKDTTLTEGVDYEIVSYDNNTDVGTAKVIINSVAGSRYKGSVAVSYSISAYLLSAPVVYTKNVYCGIRLAWGTVDGAKGYIIERKEGDGRYKRIKKITSAKKTAYNDLDVKPGKTYYYRVTGYSKGNEYRKTYCKPILTYRILSPMIDSATSSSADSMRLSWERDSRASGYQVKYVCGNEGRMFNVAKRYTAATVTGLDSGRVYRVYVRSYKNKDDKVIYSKWSKAKKVRVQKKASSSKGASLVSTENDGLDITYMSLPKASRTDIRTADEILGTESTVADYKKGSLSYSDDWEQYASYFYYNQLTAQEKKLYRALNTLCLNYLTGVDRTINRYDAGGRTYYYLPLLSLEDGEYSLTGKQAAKVYFLFRYSNPQYFFTSSILFSDIKENDDGSTGLASYIGVGVYATFATSSGVDNGKSAILATMEGWDAEISAAGSEYAKVLKIHDLIAERVIYNSAYGTASFNDEAAYTQSVYSALGWSQKKTVCAGYAFAFMMLCNKYGIDATCLTSETHQWNAVRINDQWYTVDVTWDDDPLADGTIPIWYMFFLRTDTAIDDYEAQYSSSGGENHVEEWFYSGYEPLCIHDSDFSASEPLTPGTIKGNSGTVKAPTITFDGTKVTLKAASKFATIYYTTDGTVPSVGSSKSFIYTKPFKIKKTAVVRAIAVRSGYTDSKISKLSYTLERPVLKSVTSSGGSVTVKWKKESGLSGHEIAITAGGKTRIIKVSGKKKVSKVINNLTYGKKYKIKVRSYIRSGSTMYYSNWSKVKKVRVQ